MRLLGFLGDLIVLLLLLPFLFIIALVSIVVMIFVLIFSLPILLVFLVSMHIKAKKAGMPLAEFLLHSDIADSLKKEKL